MKRHSPSIQSLETAKGLWPMKLLGAYSNWVKQKYWPNLVGAVEAKRKANKKLHEVWELSFCWKECNSHAFINQKLDYMPVRTAVAGRARQPV